MLLVLVDRNAYWLLLLMLNDSTRVDDKVLPYILCHYAIVSGTYIATGVLLLQRNLPCIHCLLGIDTDAVSDGLCSLFLRFSSRCRCTCVAPRRHQELLIAVDTWHCLIYPASFYGNNNRFAFILFSGHFHCSFAKIK